MPDAHSKFFVEWDDTNCSFTDFYNLSYNKKRDYWPYSYGSYQIYKADNLTKTFDFNSFVNVTSQDSTAFFP